MTKRAIDANGSEIHGCGECLAFECTDWVYCAAAGRQFGKEESMSFPDWCPLEKIEEKQ